MKLNGYLGISRAFFGLLLLSLSTVSIAHGEEPGICAQLFEPQNILQFRPKNPSPAMNEKINIEKIESFRQSLNDPRSFEVRAKIKEIASELSVMRNFDYEIRNKIFGELVNADIAEIPFFQILKENVAIAKAQEEESKQDRSENHLAALRKIYELIAEYRTTGHFGSLSESVRLSRVKSLLISDQIISLLQWGNAPELSSITAQVLHNENKPVEEIVQKAIAPYLDVQTESAKQEIVEQSIASTPREERLYRAPRVFKMLDLKKNMRALVGIEDVRKKILPDIIKKTRIELILKQMDEFSSVADRGLNEASTQLINSDYIDISAEDLIEESLLLSSVISARLKLQQKSSSENLFAIKREYLEKLNLIFKRVDQYRDTHSDLSYPITETVRFDRVAYLIYADSRFNKSGKKVSDADFKQLVDLLFNPLSKAKSTAGILEKFFKDK